MEYRSKGIIALLFAGACCGPPSAEGKDYILRMEAKKGYITIIDEENSRPVARYLSPDEFLSKYPAYMRHETVRQAADGEIFIHAKNRKIGKYRMVGASAGENCAIVRFMLEGE